MISVPDLTSSNGCRNLTSIVNAIEEEKSFVVNEPQLFPVSRQMWKKTKIHPSAMPRW